MYDHVYADHPTLLFKFCCWESCCLLLVSVNVWQYVRLCVCISSNTVAHVLLLGVRMTALASICRRFTLDHVHARSPTLSLRFNVLL